MVLEHEAVLDMGLGQVAGKPQRALRGRRSARRPGASGRFRLALTFSVARSCRALQQSLHQEVTT
jgi:hypothetical protein